jgi:curved DNA-binding protein CbpA
MTNYFQVLNVSEDAEPEVIRAAYKALAKKYHPDCGNFSKETAEKQMALINQAYEVLSDDFKRTEYLKALRQEAAPRREQSGSSTPNRDRESAQKASPKSDYTQRCKNGMNDLDPEEWAKMLAVVIVFISILCCIFHFGPQIVRNVFRNLGDTLEKLKYNFYLS